ncbi:MAG: hypothetical protein MHM6MM_004067 [Cercozoa sp. M6MM]
MSADDDFDSILSAFEEFEGGGGFSRGGEDSEANIDAQGLELEKAFQSVRDACYGAATHTGKIGLNVMSKERLKRMLEATAVCLTHHKRGRDRRCFKNNGIFKALRAGIVCFAILMLQDADCFRGDDGKLTADVSTVYHARICAFFDQLGELDPECITLDPEDVEFAKEENRELIRKFLNYE